MGIIRSILYRDYVRKLGNAHGLARYQLQNCSGLDIGGGFLDPSIGRRLGYALCSPRARVS